MTPEQIAARLLGSRSGSPAERAHDASILGKRGGPARARALSARRRREIGKLGFKIGRQRILAQAARGGLPDSPVLRLYGLDT